MGFIFLSFLFGKFLVNAVRILGQSTQGIRVRFEQLQPGIHVPQNAVRFFDQFRSKGDVFLLPRERLNFCECFVIEIYKRVAGTREQPRQRPTDLLPAFVGLFHQAVRKQPPRSVSAVRNLDGVGISFRSDCQTEQE